MRLIDLLRDRGMSRGDARRALGSGKVLLDGIPTADQGREIEDPDRVVVDFQLPRLQPGRDLVILHRDRGFVVVWKPAGLLSVPAPREGGQYNALAVVRRIMGTGLPVHRLDEDTSGLMLVALDEQTQLGIKALLERHEIDRNYLAIVNQHFPREAWTIDSELVRDRGDSLRGSLEVPAAPGKPPRNRRFRPPPDQHTRHARTHVELVENLDRDAAVVKATLESGRTHQVRIHLAEVGHPVLGDPLYAPNRIARRAPRLALHAYRLAFTHPATGEPLEFEIPLADDLAQLRRQLSQRSEPEGRRDAGEHSTESSRGSSKGSSKGGKRRGKKGRKKSGKKGRKKGSKKG